MPADIAFLEVNIYNIVLLYIIAHVIMLLAYLQLFNIYSSTKRKLHNNIDILNIVQYID